jgi:hypothetical protein
MGQGKERALKIKVCLQSHSHAQPLPPPSLAYFSRQTIRGRGYLPPLMAKGLEADQRSRPYGTEKAKQMVWKARGFRSGSENKRQLKQTKVEKKI